MIDIHFEINGRRVHLDQIEDALEKAMFLQAKNHIAKQLRGVIDPETGKPPKITAKGHDLSNLTFQVEGSKAVIEEVNKRLG